MHLLLLTSLPLTFATSTAISIKTTYATFTGTTDLNYNADIFIGIPFAQPPIGSLRLQPPQAINKTQGLLNVQGPFSNRCYELPIAPTTGLKVFSEDCLMLDIVRPSQLGGRGLPVYVFIHGGYYNRGDKSEYDGRNLVQTASKLGAGFIYVAINYRLSFLGFPSGKEATENGALNLGLLDQRLALQWVQKNIKAFGGNPEKVVIGGQSSGANSVAYHMLAYGGESQESQGLFQGAILESGSATTSIPVPYPDYPAWQAHYDEIVSLTGCNGASDTFSCLQVAPIDMVAAAYSTVYSESLTEPDYVYSPVVDGNFLQDYPSVLLAEGKLAPVPSMLGSTTNELSTMGSALTQAFFKCSKATYYPWVTNSTLETLLSFYPENEFQNVGPPLSGAEWTRIETILNDLRVFCPAYTQVLESSSSPSAPVWKYRWNSSLESLNVPQWQGAPQSSDLNYLFPIQSENMSNQSSEDLALMADFQRRIISFIKYFDPNKLQAPKHTPSVYWPTSSNETRTQLVFQRNGDAPGVHTEVDPVRENACMFLSSKSVEFIH